MPTATAKSFVFVARGQAEWEYARAGLVALTGDPEEFNETSYELWQYMGTVYRDLGWVHQFRHRDRPRTTPKLPKMGRVYVNIDASSEFTVQ